MPMLIEFLNPTIDSSAERENPYNPIKGLVLGEWIVARLAEQGIKASSVEPEDWGWFTDLSFEGRTYLVGFIEYEDDGSFLIQIHKQRSFFEKLTGKEKQGEDDPVARQIQSVVEASPESREIRVSTGP